MPTDKMKNYRVKTRIIATLGPASSSESILREMMKAGMDVCRINFSHGAHSSHKKYIETIKGLNKKYRRRIKIMADLAGARIRVGIFNNRKPVPLRKNQIIYMENTPSPEGDAVPFDYEGDLRDIEPAEFIYIDDGNIVLKIMDISRGKIKTRVVAGSLLNERKGVNIPGARLKFPRLTDKDKRDMDFIKTAGFNYIAQSFVRDKEDIDALKTYLGQSSGLKVVAKIENRDGIANIGRILQSADMIMIARGDMGISIPVYKVPFVQKELIEECSRNNKKSITATQMLESMTDTPFPTRAEVSDVANAVVDGSDYVMLSAETSVGKHPVKCVRMMNEIIKYSEIYLKTSGKA